MQTIYRHIREHFFFYILGTLITIVAILSYNRFLIRHDYVVEYEGVCDPVKEICFTACENEECTEHYYYSIMQKYEPILRSQCGTDITDCESASMCMVNEYKCSITYCGENTGETCETLTELNQNELLQENNQTSI